MEKCNCKNESEVLRIVRGNAFTINIAIEAVRLDGSVVENFDLGASDAVLRVIHAGKKTEKEFIVDENNAIIAFEGTDTSGWYGLEMNGVYDAKPWRWCVENVFQLVETNEKANIPSWTFVIDSTYFVTGVMTLMSGDRAQADWAETNPMSASYIRNKPIIYTQAEVNALLQAEAQARQQGISNEATARQQADQTLQGNITAEATARQQADATLQANIDAEETRATEAEQANATAISAERTRATTVEGSLQENINTEEAARVSADQTLQNSIETEEARATAAEQALQANVDTEEAARIAADQVLDGKITDSTAAIAAEEARAKAAEQVNATAISNEVTRATTAEGTLQSNIDAEETARIAADNALDAKIGNNTSAIAAEVTRATAAEQANATAISNEVTRATTAEGTLQDNIDAEEADRITADATLQGNIDNEEAARIAADQVLDGKITDSTAAIAAEEARAMAAEQSNATAISNEVTRATAAEDTLQDNIDAEEAARIAADNALDTKIGTNTSAIASEVTRATAAEGANATAISNEVTRATTAESTLQDNIDAEETRAKAAEQANATAIASEVTRATAAEQANATAISNEVTRATTAEGTLQDNIDAEETRAKAAEQTNATAIAAEATRAAAAEQANATDIADEVTRATAAEGDLQDNIDTEAAARIAGDQTLQGNINALISNTYTKAQVDALTADFITASVNNLLNYYLKSETYTQSEVDALIASVQQFQYKVVDVLPTASAATMNIIFLVPSPTAPNSKDSFVTIDNGVGADPRYTWEQIGSTDIDLSGYYTSQQTDAAITAALNTALANYTTTANLTTLLAGKQDVISDLSTIRSGAAAGATAYQKPSTGIPKTDMASAVQTSLGKADTAYQKPSNGIPSTDMTSAVQTSLGKAETAYQKPSNGIPSTDMTSAVQTSLGKADTAYQKPSTGIPESDLDAATQQKINATVDITGKADKVSGAIAGDFAGLDANGNLTDSGKKASDFATAAQGSLADTAYQKPATGIPSTDMSEAVQASLGKADTAIQDISGKADKVNGATNGDFAGLDANGNLTDSGKKTSDFATAAQGALADSAYQKPSGGIPKTDLASAVQTSLGKADTAIQDVSGKADKVANATNGDFAGLDANGNLTDSGKKASDFATAAQGALADTAYQKPSGGIPDTDLSSAVQTSLGKADTAIQDVSGKADKVSGATENDFAGLDANGNLKDSGKKASDFATAAQGALADTAYQKPSGGIPDTDLSSAVQTSLGKADTAYQKPSGGIPKTDLASAVQTSLGKADTAIQDISGKADKVSGAASGDFAGLDSNGNLTDSGKKASDFATAAQGALADTAYQKPSTGIPKTDMASAVQTSLGKADSALQSQVNADWNSNSGASMILNKPTTMGASGSGHKGGLVPDTPSIAGTTKFLREDGTWDEPSGGGGGNITVESNSSPTSSTTTYTKDGVTKNYVVGDKIIVPNAQSNSGYDVYVLLNITSNTATWGAIDADDGRVIVTVRVYDNDNTNLALTTATIAINGGTATAMAGVMDTAGHKKTFTATGLEVGDTFVITFGTLQDYGTPRNITGTKGTEADLYSVTYRDLSAVDLGLTSGTLWAQGNIMKDGNGDYYMGDETDYGCLFSWGNVDGHPTDGGITIVPRGENSVPYPIGTDGFVFKEENYWDWSTFLSLQGWTAQEANRNGFYEQDFGNGTPGMSVIADIASNDTTHDAAAATLGGDWHMPSKDDFQELLDETDHEWVTNYNNSGVNGYKFMKRSDHSVFIFMPAIPYTLGGEPFSEFGAFWSRSFYDAWDAWNLDCDSSDMYAYSRLRYNGCAVRAVQ